MAPNERSFRHERRRRVGELRQQGHTTKQIAIIFARDYRESPLKAFRWAHDWTLDEACERYNNDVADDPEQEAMSYRRLSEYENWPGSATSTQPRLTVLQGFAMLYQCAPGDLFEGTDYTLEAEQHASTPATSSQDAAYGEQATAAPPTLLRVLVTRRHWRPYEVFRMRYERAARELAERDQDPRLGRLSVGRRQFERWLAGTLQTKPYPDHCRVLEFLFGLPVDELFSPASEGSGTTRPDALMVSERLDAGDALLAGDRLAAPSAAVALGVEVGSGAVEAAVGGSSAQDEVFREALAAARKQAGRELARFRNEAGLSQQDLANRIGYTRAQVAGAESATNATAAEFWGACDEVFRAGGVLVAARGRVEGTQRARREAAVRRDAARREVRLQQWRAEHGHSGAGLANGAGLTSVEFLPDSALPSGWPLPWGTMQRLTPLLNRADPFWFSGTGASLVNRLDFLRSVAAAAGLVVFDPEPWERLTRSLKEPRLLDNETVSGLEAGTAGFFLLEEQLPARRLAELLSRHVDALTGFLNMTPEGQLRRRLASTAGEAAVLAGWLSFDMKDHATARAYYGAAEDAAAEADDAPLLACALGYRSYMASAEGNRRQAIAFLERAHELANGQDNALTRSWVAGRNAEENAALGHKRDALAALEVAAAEFEAARRDDERVWTRFFTEGRMGGLQVNTYARLGDPRLQHAAQDLLDSLGPIEVKAHAISLAAVARAFFQTGAVEEGVSHADHALVVALRTECAIALSQLSELQPYLKRTSDRAARDLDEKLQAALLTAL
jgi:DNA-binding transcriptional regulator YiaG